MQKGGNQGGKQTSKDCFVVLGIPAWQLEATKLLPLEVRKRKPSQFLESKQNFLFCFWVQKLRMIIRGTEGEWEISVDSCILMSTRDCLYQARPLVHLTH